MSALKELQNYTFTSKYARWDKDKQRRETWKEAVDRVRNMMLTKYADKGIDDDINWAYDMMQQKKVLGSQRNLQYGGDAVLKKNLRQYNCLATYIDRLRAFQEYFYALLCGSGVGISVQKQHIEKLPTFSSATHSQKKIYVIPDTIEGWADSLGVLLSSYFENPVFPEYYKYDVQFDYSQIRPEGSPLSSGVGKAPGPQGLKNALEKIRDLLNRCIQNQQAKLRSIDAYDICMHASDAVLSGGVRRSSSIAVFSFDDDEMKKAKTGNWFYDNPQRARANNSVALLRSETTFEQFQSIIQHTKEFGEPGFIWMDDLGTMTNPCQPAWATVLTQDGIRTIGDINIGDKIWSSEGWTTVMNKWSTGINKVFKYETTGGRFFGTQDHKVMSCKIKTKVKHADSIDILPCNIYFKNCQHDPQAIMDGLVLGDGSVHKASNNLIYLCIGQNDSDYFSSEIKDLIIKHRPGLSTCSYEIKTTLTHNDIVKTYNRSVPQKYITANPNIVCSFLRGLYSANGSICGKRITLKSASKNIIEDVQLMLSSIGIRSYYTTNSSSITKFVNGTYESKESYDLNIGPDIELFLKYIGFIQQYKNDKTMYVIQKKTKKGMPKSTFDITNVKFLNEEETFDITVDNNSHTYWSGGCNISNCSEISLYPVDVNTGESGFQGCNLSTINCSTIKDVEDFYERAKAAAIIGTLQAGFTVFPYLGKTSENIFKRESLLGVSMTGMMEKFEIVLNPENQKHAAEIVKETNKKYAKLIDISPAARTTCNKPEGCLVKSSIVQTNSGILSLEEVGDINGDIWQECNFNVMTDRDNERAKYFYCNGYSQTKKILTSGGITLEGTLQHKIRVLRNDNYIWVKFKDLKVKDILPYRVGGYNGGTKQELKKPTHTGSVHIQKQIKYIDYIDEQFAWFLGLYIGDGSNHPKKYGIRIHGDYTKQQHLLKAQQYLMDVFGLDTQIRRFNDDPNEKRCALYISSKRFYQFLQYNNLLKNKSQNIEIPLSIRMSKSSVIEAFIDGYGCADGCDKGPVRSFCTTSKLMATQLTQCLRAIGKDCKMRLMPPTKSSYGTSMRYWIQERKGRTSERNAQFMKYYKALDKHELYDHSADTIVDIQDSYNNTYDLSVDSNEHTYIANSYISHNSVSCMLGTSSGIHPHHAKRYIRRVQANRTENVYQYFKQNNPQACEASVWSQNDTDDIIMFPVEVPDGSKTKNQLPALKMLEIVKSTQANWIQSGKNVDLCVKPSLSHSVSNTIIVQDDEWDDVTKYIYDNRAFFVGVSLISQSGDKDYPQAPFCTVYTSREIVKEYGEAAIWCSGLIELGLLAFDGNLWEACNAAINTNYISHHFEKNWAVDDYGHYYLTSCSATYKKECDKIAWIEKARKFANKYFEGDVKKLTYCLKDVHNWKIYNDLKDAYQPVDYTKLIETDDFTKPEEEMACSGGACLI